MSNQRRRRVDSVKLLWLRFQLLMVDSLIAGFIRACELDENELRNARPELHRNPSWLYTTIRGRRRTARIPGIPDRGVQCSPRFGLELERGRPSAIRFLGRVTVSA